MTAFLYRMPSGIPGAVTRQSQSTIETGVFDGTLPFSGYGLFGKIASGKFVPVGAGDAAAAVYALLVRPFPTQGANPSDPIGVAVPITTGANANMLRRGYANVKVNAGTAAFNGPVYIRVAAAAAGKPIGGIEAAADSTNTIQVTGAIFMAAADASGNAEIAFNI